MDFEYDFRKSGINKIKHGIDFKDAQRMWEGEVVEMNSRREGELRKLVVGKIDGVYWTAITTRRGRNIRVISVRRARGDERSFYENQI
ncbi:MAG: BrnT family toxin [bacterium]